MCRHLPQLLPAMALLALCGCAATPYRNATHPDYGETQYKSDLAQCRSQNSTVVTSYGYDPNSSVKVDEAKAQSCMNERGWQAARP